MVDELEHKYEVKVQAREGRQKLPNDVKEILKEGGMMDEKGKLKLKGVSPKMLKKMKGKLETKIEKISFFLNPSPDFSTRLSNVANLDFAFLIKFSSASTEITF